MKRILIPLLVFTGLAIVLITSGWFYFEQKITNPSPEAIPDNLAALPLMDQMTGRQAAFDFSQLHGKQFPLTSGAVGIYGDHQATLWVAGAPLKGIAARMVSSMREKIAEGRSPFTPTAEISDNKRTIYVLEGMGQKHYYFQSENLVIWLAIEADHADKAIQQLQEFYP